MKFYPTEWSKTTITSSVYMTLLLVLFVMKQDFPLFLLWLHTPIYFLHEFEEYILPEGFLTFFNTKILGSKNPEMPLDVKRSFWINVPLIFFAYPLSAILATNSASGGVSGLRTSQSPTRPRTLSCSSSTVTTQA